MKKSDSMDAKEKENTTSGMRKKKVNNMDYWEPVRAGDTYHMKCSACGNLIPLFTKEGKENRPDSCEVWSRYDRR